jgi:REP element-mobilizing transposase RayT
VTYYQRNLPHWQPEGKGLFVTWRLWGTLPAGVWSQIKARADLQKSARARVPAPPKPSSAGEFFLAMDRALEKTGRGAKWLENPNVASAVLAIIRRGEELRHYDLHAFVIMPNHVHILIEPLAEPVRLLRALKGASARDANRILGRVGHHFWQDESFDHWVRTGAEFDRIRDYIQQNPVKTGLVHRPEDWAWSSAMRQGAG